MGRRDRGRLDGPTFRMREKVMSLGDDYWIEDDRGAKVFKVDGKAARLRDTFVLQDAAGTDLATIREKKLTVRDTMTIELAGSHATVRKRLLGIRDHYVIEVDGGDELQAHGNVVGHEYQIERDGMTVARVSKQWFSIRDTYGVQLADGQDAALVLAIAVCVDAMARG
jgi:uncharacterized protein YxjI